MTSEIIWAVVESFKAGTVLAAIDSRKAICPTRFDMIQNVHQIPVIGPNDTRCQLAGSWLARQRSFIACKGFHKPSIGTKKNPTAQPGVNLRPSAPNARTFLLA